MSYAYANKKRPANAERKAEPATAQPSLDALRSGAAMPSEEQLGHRADLPDAMREKMESAFGADLSAVKLYESRTVADAGARAVSQGTRIAFAPGMLDFSSHAGQALLGHELSHVVSQARGEVTGSGFLNDRALEARADREGAMAAAGQTVAMPAAALSSVSAAPAAGPMQASKTWPWRKGDKKGAAAAQSADAAQSAAAAQPANAAVDDEDWDAPPSTDTSLAPLSDEDYAVPRQQLPSMSLAEIMGPADEMVQAAPKNSEEPKQKPVAAVPGEAERAYADLDIPDFDFGDAQEDEINLDDYDVDDDAAPEEDEINLDDYDVDGDVPEEDEINLDDYDTGDDDFIVKRSRDRKAEPKYTLADLQPFVPEDEGDGFEEGEDDDWDWAETRRKSTAPSPVPGIPRKKKEQPPSVSLEQLLGPAGEMVKARPKTDKPKRRPVAAAPSEAERAYADLDVSGLDFGGAPKQSAGPQEEIDPGDYDVDDAAPEEDEINLDDYDVGDEEAEEDDYSDLEAPTKFTLAHLLPFKPETGEEADDASAEEPAMPVGDESGYADLDISGFDFDKYKKKK